MINIHEITRNKLSYTGLHRVPVRPRFTIIDKKAATTQVDAIYSGEVNVSYLADYVSDPEILELLTNFFLRRESVELFRQVIPVKVARTDEIFTTKDSVLAVLGSLPSAKAAGAIMELLAGPLMHSGMLSKTGEFSRYRRHGKKPVTIFDLVRELALFNLSSVVQDLKAKIKIEGVRIAIQPMAESYATELRAIGEAMRDTNVQVSILRDIVRGVRARIDPFAETNPSLSSTVDPDWRDHAVVKDLSENLVFIEAAAAIGTDAGICADLVLEKGEYQRNHWAPMILTALQSSDRYGIVGGSTLIREYTLRRVRDLSKNPIFSLLSHSVNVAPIAQAVRSTDDYIVPDATVLTVAKDRVADLIAKCYHKGMVGHDALAEDLIDAVQLAVNEDLPLSPTLAHIDLGSGDVTVRDIAAFVSHEVYLLSNGEHFITELRMTPPVEGAEKEVDGDELAPAADADAVAKAERTDSEQLAIAQQLVMEYHAICVEEQFLGIEGTAIAGRLTTTSAAEVLFCCELWSSDGEVPARQQIIGPEGFGPAMIGFDEKEALIDLRSSRYSYNLAIGQKVVRGAMQPDELLCLRAAPHVKLTSPVYNAAVAESFFEAARTFWEMLKLRSWGKAPNKGDFSPKDYILRNLALKFIRRAELIPEAFAKEMQRHIINSAISTEQLTGVEAEAMRDAMKQRVFASAATVVAYGLFWHCQGVDMKNWKILMSDPIFQRTLVEHGLSK